MGMRVRINLNDTVYCKLTEHGESEVSDDLDTVAIERLPARGMQLWELLSALGCKSMFNGARPVIERNTIEFELDQDVKPGRKSIDGDLVADVLACLGALGKASTDPVARALAHRLIRELAEVLA